MTAALCLALHLGNRFLTETIRRQLELTPGFEQFTRIQLGQRYSALLASAEKILANISPASVLTPHDADYPHLLRETAHAPFALFLKGDRSLLMRDKVSMVGTREPSAAGREAAIALARDFSRSGKTIVSGIARGIDSLCHHAALEAGGSTIAVLPNGHNHLYPLENRDIYEKAREGRQILLVSEYLPDQKPMKHHFVRRNRIIAGLSDLTVFVEGPLKSGAMITVGVALSEGRDVAALRHPNLLANAGGEKLIAEGAIDVTDRAFCAQTLPE
ncbi:DNA-processing protein DprA [Turneriella parva]|uniref:DNA protecting protein DprA n=1 Tax=Turneriella parva (strain ATCC BAA-1111 / DSM 21527 / NCTC 11395 / H) TaxID=869212 RepID=I4B979_TURPD|nr:DNA-processing protein DprA [Turneriella parva]AFM13836.1 DNA protecting protein DprA [Turneriella parva DSM 21527]